MNYASHTWRLSNNYVSHTWRLIYNYASRTWRLIYGLRSRAPDEKGPSEWPKGLSPDPCSGPLSPEKNLRLSLLRA